MTAPRATVRLQLNRDFDLAAAAAQVPYYAELGVSHVYLSPIAQARAGSSHGYDVTDPTVVNPELGGERALAMLSATLRAHGMGAILDIVPNHMAADVANPWWRDVLARGRGSRHAGWFDIDWDAPGTGGKLWLPWLDAPLEHVLRRGGLRLVRDAGKGRVGLAVNDGVLPVSAASLRLLRAQAPPGGGARLDRAIARTQSDPRLLRRVLELQHYRLAWWRSGSEVGNYRRFFDVGDLVALDMQRPEVFEAVHRLPLRLIAEGVLDGLRIDHVDGLAQPRAYLRKLRRRVDRAARGGVRPERRPVLYVEKILADGEELRADWLVDGDTGYAFMQQADAVLHDPAGRAPLEQAWQAFTGRAPGFGAEERRARRELLQGSLATDLARCVRAFARHVADTPERGDLTAPALRQALGELLEQLPAYRSYLGPVAARGADRAVLEHAFAQAARHGDPDHAQARAMLYRRLLDIAPCALPLAPRHRLREARQRFEQLSAALDAKAVEDTAFYRCGVLLSRNEVGSDPRHFALSVEDFHAAMQRRAQRWPDALSATATHDHKRGEDIRARLAVLGERAEWFVQRARAWQAALGAERPSGNAVWTLLQTVLAAWPPGMSSDDAPAVCRFAGRIERWLLKAEREAKQHTRWTSPDPAYEGTCRAAVERLLLAHAGLRRELAEAARGLDAPGALNGLAAATLRLTAPGVPDLYQGTELWDLSLVDPDNRAPVDYAARRRSLDADASPAALLAGFRDGAVKQRLIRDVLRLRRDLPQLFARGDYRPLAVHGARRAHLLAFERRHGPCRLQVAVPRLCAHALAPDRPLVAPAFWGDTRIAHAADAAPCTYVDLFTGRTHRPGPDGLPAGALLEGWPVAVLLSTGGTDEHDTLRR
ncbi:malto-oligosyltrehalose synthase [Fulvimonas sp. R45]|uniref:malto-oligosyltrehalose synthase n=1 Tax=Fulvimonas sp. R45 TaxID=3045937 RepID=UPI00265F23DC|nr:malto-oligosyltrehalose synthase [Fulvimonas sp. R45]MDO1528807.1 malto-oligosyltrehalose synthase [Fulvimonas sp. R45]